MALLGVVPVICEQSEKYGHENRDSKVMSDSVCKQAYDNCWKYGWDSLQYILPSEHTDDLIWRPHLGINVFLNSRALESSRWNFLWAQHL